MNDRPSLFPRILVLLRAFSFTASASAVFAGIAIARFRGAEMWWGGAGLTLIGALAFHGAANILNDVVDFQRGLDREALPMSGAVVRGWVSPSAALRTAIALLLLGALVGLILAWQVGWGILIIGLVGAVCAVGYTLPGLCFKYSALGDIAILVAFGACIVVGAYWVQAEVWCWAPLLWSIPIGLPTVAILHANNWRDRERDREGGCRTVARLLGARGAGVYYRILMLAPIALAIGYTVWGRLVVDWLAPSYGWVVLFSLPMAVRMVRMQPKDEASFATLVGGTVQFQLVFAVLCGVGFLLG